MRSAGREGGEQHARTRAGQVERTLGDREADGDEDVRCWQKGQRQQRDAAANARDARRVATAPRTHAQREKHAERRVRQHAPEARLRPQLAKQADVQASALLM